MRSPVLSCLLFAAALSAAPAAAQQPAEAPAGPEVTLAKLVAVRNLRCDALRRGKTHTMMANIHRSEVEHASGVTRIKGEQQVAEDERAAGAAFEEAASVKGRLQRMGEGFISARRLEWYGTVDVAKKIRIERKIEAAKEILGGGCDQD